MSKHYDITITNKDKGTVVRTTTLSEEQIERFGGIGNYIESISTLLIHNETIEVTLYRG